MYLCPSWTCSISWSSCACGLRVASTGGFHGEATDLGSPVKGTDMGCA